MWQVSKILGDHVAGGPFGKPVSEYSTPQLDFVLEMAAKDDPDMWTFTRPGGEPRQSEKMARWIDVLAGPMLQRFMMSTGLAKASQGVAAWRARKSAPVVGKDMKQGLTRGGQSVGAKRDGGKN